MNPIRVVVDDEADGLRLDALVARAGGWSRARAAELVAAGAVAVDGRREDKSYRVRAGETVVMEPVEVVREEREAAMPPVIFEDEHLVVVDKPAGLVVHPGGGQRSGTLVDALRASGRPLAPRAGDDRPGIVHRLDKDVSGLLVVAKTDQAHEALVEAIAQRLVRREYLAAVAGAPEVDAGKIEAPIGRHPKHRTKMAVLAEGKPSVTWFRVRERLRPHGGPETASLLEVRLETGRTHQIRAHLASIGLPILGDPEYGRDSRLVRALGLRRPFLHAFRLQFAHPVSGQPVALTSELPADLRAALEEIRA